MTDRITAAELDELEQELSTCVIGPWWQEEIIPRLIAEVRKQKKAVKWLAEKCESLECNYSVYDSTIWTSERWLEEAYRDD